MPFKNISNWAPSMWHHMPEKQSSQSHYHQNLETRIQFSRHEMLISENWLILDLKKHVFSLWQYISWHNQKKEILNGIPSNLNHFLHFSVIVGNWKLPLIFILDPSITITDVTTDLMCMVQVAEIPPYSLWRGNAVMIWFVLVLCLHHQSMRCPTVRPPCKGILSP